jgi:peptidoglycan/xylan/chitin deacetylase (PgdA/CDA1 family)
VTWPSDARCAVAFTFDFDAEEVWLAGDPDAASKPGLLSMGAYGANVGVPEILRLLDRRGLPATFFVPGRVAEMHPDRVRDIVAAGHELGAHGYTHRSPTSLTRVEEEEELRKTKTILEGFGTAVRGYRSPAWEFSVNTLELLAGHGIGYSSNLMDRLHPYRHPNGVVELPVQWLLDDAAHFWFSPDEWVKKISTPSEVREIWEEELLGIRDLGGLCVLTMHPQVIGRPSRLRFLDSFMGMVQELDGVWVAGCADIADTVTSS